MSNFQIILPFLIGNTVKELSSLDIIEMVLCCFSLQYSGFKVKERTMCLCNVLDLLMFKVVCESVFVKGSKESILQKLT